MERSSELSRNASKLWIRKFVDEVKGGCLFYECCADSRDECAIAEHSRSTNEDFSSLLNEVRNVWKQSVKSVNALLAESFKQLSAFVEWRVVYDNNGDSDAISMRFNKQTLNRLRTSEHHNRVAFFHDLFALITRAHTTITTSCQREVRSYEADDTLLSRGDLLLDKDINVHTHPFLLSLHRYGGFHKIWHNVLHVLERCLQSFR